MAFSPAPLPDPNDYRHLTQIIIPGQLTEHSSRPPPPMNQYLPAGQQQQQLAYAPPHLRPAAGPSLSSSISFRSPSTRQQPSAAFLYRTPHTGEEGDGRQLAAQRRPPLAPQLHSHQPYRPTSSPSGPFHAIASSLPQANHSVSPHAVGRLPFGATPGLHQLGRTRKPGTGHRMTDSIGPPPKAKLGGAVVGIPSTPADSIAIRKKVVVKLPRSASHGDEAEPLWVRYLPHSDDEGVYSVASSPPAVFSKELWPLMTNDWEGPEQEAIAVHLPSKHMWEKLKRSSQNVGPSSPSFASSVASRSLGVFDHRSTSSLDRPASSSFARLSHRPSPSIASAIFARPFSPLKVSQSDASRLASFNPHSIALLGNSEPLATFPDGVPIVVAPVPRRNALLDFMFDDEKSEAPARDFLEDDGSLTNPSDEDVRRWSNMPRRASLISLNNPGTYWVARAVEDDFISNPSEDDDARACSHSAMAWSNAHHSASAAKAQDIDNARGGPASYIVRPELNPRAPAFVFDRPTTAILHSSQTGLQPEQLGSPLKLAQDAAAQSAPLSATATAALGAAAPFLLSILDDAPPAVDRPLQSLSLSNLPNKRPFNVAAPAFQPRVRQNEHRPLTPQTDNAFQFVPPPRLPTLQLPAPLPAVCSPSRRPLPMPPVQKGLPHRHEGDAEPIKRSRVHEPSDSAIESTSYLPLSLPHTSSNSDRGFGGEPSDRMHSFRMPVSAVSILSEGLQPQDTLPFAFDSSSVNKIAMEEAFVMTGRSDTVGPISKQRPPIPIFGSPPDIASTSFVAPVTPARPLPAISASTPRHHARCSLAGSNTTDEDDELSLASVRRRLRSGPLPSANLDRRPHPSQDDHSAEHAGQLVNLDRQSSVIIDDKLNTSRLSGTRGGIVHLASLHPDAEQSLLGRLAAMLEERDAVNGLADSTDAILEAVEEGYRVVCERLEGSITENLQALCSPSSVQEAGAERLETQARLMEDLIMQLKIQYQRVDEHAATNAEVVIGTLRPIIQSAERATSLDLSKHVLPRLDGLESNMLTEEDVAKALRRALVDDRNQSSIDSNEERILLAISELAKEVHNLLSSSTERRLLQQTAVADNVALAKANDQIKHLEADKTAAIERAYIAASENAAKDKEIGALQAQTQALEREIQSQKSQANETWHARDIFESTIVQQLHELTSSLDKGNAAEKRERDVVAQMVALEKRLAVSDEKLQSQQRAALASAAISKTALANSSLRLQEAETTVRTLKEALQTAENERRACGERASKLEIALASERKTVERFQQQSSEILPETPRAVQPHRPPSEASSCSWSSPHPLVRHLQDQVRLLSPPPSTLRTSHKIAAPNEVPSPVVISGLKGTVASIWAPRSRSEPHRNVTPVSRPVTVKPPDESDDGWWTAA